jgi:hypothetical protein
MEGSSKRALEVAPNETLVVGHETAFQNSHDVFEDCAKHGESQIPKLLSCFLRQKNIGRNKSNNMLGSKCYISHVNMSKLT